MPNRDELQRSLLNPKNPGLEKRTTASMFVGISPIPLAKPGLGAAIIELSATEAHKKEYVMRSWTQYIGASSLHRTVYYAVVFEWILLRS